MQLAFLRYALFKGHHDSSFALHTVVKERRVLQPFDISSRKCVPSVLSIMSQTILFILILPSHRRKHSSQASLTGRLCLDDTRVLTDNTSGRFNSSLRVSYACIVMLPASLVSHSTVFEAGQTLCTTGISASSYGTSDEAPGMRDDGMSSSFRVAPHSDFMRSVNTQESRGVIRAAEALPTGDLSQI